MKEDEEKKLYKILEKILVFGWLAYAIFFIIYAPKKFEEFRPQYRENSTSIMSTKSNANEEYRSKDCQHQSECNYTNQKHQQTDEQLGDPALVVALFMVIFIFYITVIK